MAVAPVERQRMMPGRWMIAHDQILATRQQKTDTRFHLTSASHRAFCNASCDLCRHVPCSSSPVPAGLVIIDRQESIMQDFQSQSRGQELLSRFRDPTTLVSIVVLLVVLAALHR